MEALAADCYRIDKSRAWLFGICCGRQFSSKFQLKHFINCFLFIYLMFYCCKKLFVRQHIMNDGGAKRRRREYISENYFTRLRCCVCLKIWAPRLSERPNRCTCSLFVVTKKERRIKVLAEAFFLPSIFLLLSSIHSTPHPRQSNVERVRTRRKRATT